MDDRKRRRIKKKKLQGQGGEGRTHTLCKEEESGGNVLRKDSSFLLSTSKGVFAGRGVMMMMMCTQTAEPVRVWAA